MLTTSLCKRRKHQQSVEDPGCIRVKSNKFLSVTQRQTEYNLKIVKMIGTQNKMRIYILLFLKSNYSCKVASEVIILTNFGLKELRSCKFDLCKLCLFI